MQQTQVVLSQVLPKARFRQIPGSEQKHEFVARIGGPRRLRGLDQAREKDGQARLPEKQIARRCRQPHCQPVEFLGDDDLATEPGCLGQIEGEVEHVVLILARLLQQIVPIRIDDDVTGRAGERPFARTFNVDVISAGDLEDLGAERRVNFAPGTIAPDKNHPRHQPGSGAAAREELAQHRYTSASP